MTKDRSDAIVNYRCPLHVRFALLVIFAIAFLCILGVVTDQSFPALDKNNYVFLRIVGVIAIFALLVQSVRWIWLAYCSQHIKSWWNLGIKTDEPSWHDVLKMTAGECTYDPISYGRPSRDPTWFTDCGYTAMLITVFGVTIELVTVLWRNKILNIFLSEAANTKKIETVSAGQLLNFSQNLTAFLALTAAIASIYFTYRQLQAKVKADSRQAWIDKLRANIATFVALVDRQHYHTRRNKAELTTRRIEMEMLLNPSEKDHRLLMYLTIKLAFFDSGNRDFLSIQDVRNIIREIQKDPEYKWSEWKRILAPIPPKDSFIHEMKYSDLIGYTIRLSHVVLKREWERVKSTR